VPCDEESLSELVLEVADESPDVADWEPLPEPLEAFDALLLLLVEPPEAFALLLFVELPEPEALCELSPALPPLAVLVAAPELPEFAVELLEPPDDEFVACELPVLPVSAELSALPPLESPF
jgi:hypothetical protein